MKSSANAKKHGLSVNLASDYAPDRVEQLACAFAGDRVERMPQAREAALARLHMQRVRAIKALTLNGAVLQVDEDDRDQTEAQALLACLDQQIIIDGYERKAVSRYRRALRAVWD